MSVVPGWYPDPSPQNLDGRGMRYWDGQAWTGHVHHPGYAPVLLPAPVPMTGDGQVLAQWWQRLFALVIDGLISSLLLIASLTPLVVSQWENIHTWFDDQIDRADAGQSFSYSFPGGTYSDLPDIFNPLTGAGLAFVAIILGVGVVYNVGFLLWKQATPGKLMLGLRVRLRESPDLPLSAILRRYGFVLGLTVLGLIPFVGTAAGLVNLVDDFWVFQGHERQTLHDKVAGTQVVKIR